MSQPISAIIPAFNEAKRISQILEVLRKVQAVKEIIVVDDGSSDDTAGVAGHFSGVKVIRSTYNQGKTKSVRIGVREAKYEALLLMDADLEGLKPFHLTRLIDVWSSGYRMMILNYSSQEWVLRTITKGFPALSGVRCLEKKDFNQIKFLDTDRFELETRINRFFLDRKLPIGWIEGRGVRTPHKLAKYGPIYGNWLEYLACREIAFANGRLGGWGLLKQWHQIAGMRVNSD